MTVFFVGAGPGDPELLTRRAERRLREARVCLYAGSLINPALLDLLPAAAERHDTARLALDEIIALMQSAHEQGKDVVRLHTGEPTLYGAIGEQMARLDRMKIPYEVVPGVSAFQAAAAALKRELTAPETAQTVIVSRVAGRTPVPESEALPRLAAIQGTLCLYLSADRLAEIAEQLAAAYGEDCPAAVVFHASWPDEIVVRGTIADIAEKSRVAGITKTAVILVGRALAGIHAESRLYAADFSHGWREGEYS